MGLFFCSLYLAQARVYLTFELSAVLQNMLALKLTLKDPVQMVHLISKLWYTDQNMGKEFLNFSYNINICDLPTPKRNRFIELRTNKRLGKEDYMKCVLGYLLLFGLILNYI